MYKVLEGKTINLRRIEVTDAASIAENANEKEIIEAINLPDPYTQKNAEEYVLKTKADWDAKKEAQFGMEDKVSGRIIGMIGLMDLDFESGRGEIGYWLGKKYWGKGIASEALSLIIEYAFNDLKLKRVFARAAGTNMASNNLLERNGFVLEGRLRQHGKYMDLLDDELIWGLLDSDVNKFNHN